MMFKHDHVPTTCFPAVCIGAGGLGKLWVLHLRCILWFLFGTDIAQFLPVALGSTDADQGSEGLSLPAVNGSPAIVLEPEESFTPHAQLVSQLRSAGMRDPLLAARAERIPERFREDTSKGSGGDRGISRMVVAAQHREYEAWMLARFSLVRDRTRREQLRTRGVTSLLDRATGYIQGHYLFGGFGNGVALDLATIAGSLQERDGFINGRRTAIVGAPDSGANEDQGRANGQAFIKDNARTIREPGTYISRGFGGRAIGCCGPAFTDILPVSRTNSRLVSPDRTGIARQMAWAAASLIVGEVASTLESRLQDARRHLATVPDSERRFLLRLGVATGNFSREAVIETATDVLVCATADYLREGVACSLSRTS